MKSFCYTLFWAGRKIAQIGETERKQDWSCFRLPEGVHGYAERRSLFKTRGTKIEEIRHLANFFLAFHFTSISLASIKALLCTFLASCDVRILLQLIFSLLEETGVVK